MPAARMCVVVLDGPSEQDGDHVLRAAAPELGPGTKLYFRHSLE